MTKKANYLICDDVRRDPALKQFFDTCVDSILNGTTRGSKTRALAGYPSYPCFRIEGREILTDAILEYYFGELGKTGFYFEKARYFAEIMRKLCGWKWGVDRILRVWVDTVIRDPFFYNKSENGNSWSEHWVLKPGEPSYQLSEDYMRFACYIAVSHIKYGANYDQLTAQDIFSFVTALGSDLPTKLKKYGSGDLPKDVSEYKDDALSCKANDVFATIKITLKEESEQNYKKV